MTKTKLHFALIKNDSLPPEIASTQGDYLEQYSSIFGQAAQAHSLDITWEEFDVVDAQEYPSLQDIEQRKYDAVVLSGSKSDAHDNHPWILKLIDFLQTLFTQYFDKVKLIGFCFGHQVLLRAAGGKTGRNQAGWEVGLTTLQLNQEGKQLFKTERDFIQLNEFHQDHVSALPKGFKTLAFSKDHTPNQIVVSENGQCITVQGHPEFNRGTIVSLIHVTRENETLTREFAESRLEILNNAPLKIQDVWLTEKIIDFVLA